jgi:hypothetical protein
MLSRAQHNNNRNNATTATTATAEWQGRIPLRSVALTPPEAQRPGTRILRALLEVRCAVASVAPLTGNRGEGGRGGAGAVVPRTDKLAGGAGPTGAQCR